MSFKEPPPPPKTKVNSVRKSKHEDIKGILAEREKHINIFLEILFRTNFQDKFSKFMLVILSTRRQETGSVQ